MLGGLVLAGWSSFSYPKFEKCNMKKEELVRDARALLDTNIRSLYGVLRGWDNMSEILKGKEVTDSINRQLQVVKLLEDLEKAEGRYEQDKNHLLFKMSHDSTYLLQNFIDKNFWWNGSLKRHISIDNSLSNSIAMEKGRIGFPHNWVVPWFSPSGEILTSIPKDSPNSHCQVRIQDDGTDYLIKNAWTKPNLTYTWSVTLQLGEGDWSGWCAALQGHPGAYGSEWANPHSKQPSFALYIIKDRWVVYARGSDEIRPAWYMYRPHRYSSDVIIPGRTYEVVITFRADPVGEGSYFRCAIGNEILMESHSPLGINYSALPSRSPSLMLAAGYYGNKANTVLTIKDMELSVDLSGEEL